MAGKKRGVQRYQPPSYSTAGSVEKYRTRTPYETTDDAYTAIVQATALNTVSHLAMDGVSKLAAHREALLADNPELRGALDALTFNAVQGYLTIQRQVSDNVRREKS